MVKMIDSREKTQEHIDEVRKQIDIICDILKERGKNHDKSKLEDFEKPYFDENTENLAKEVYGSEEYKKSLEKLKPALEHHYKVNSHHPEHYENGIDGMNIYDIIEMWADWNAAVKRNKDGDIRKSLEINSRRFNLSNQLINIFNNTIEFNEDQQENSDILNEWLNNHLS
jgi:hypothetical protein